jgi:sugar lactone lactonase YvrE
VVERVDLAGNVSVVAEVPHQPSGLGWLPDGDLLIVSMRDRKLLRLSQTGELKEYADLSSVATSHCNDMVVDANGRAYVGNFGFDRHSGENSQGANLALVDRDQAVVCAAEDLMFPNGSVVTDDGQTLVVGETMGQVLTAFDIAADGTLDNRRVWADLGAHYPDGICLDEEGAIWVADPRGNALVRVAEGGHILQLIQHDRPVYACMLGGDDGRRLFACTGLASGPEAAATQNGRIEFVDVDVPHAGLP